MQGKHVSRDCNNETNKRTNKQTSAPKMRIMWFCTSSHLICMISISTHTHTHTHVSLNVHTHAHTTNLSFRPKSSTPARVLHSPNNTAPKMRTRKKVCDFCSLRTRICRYTQQKFSCWKMCYNFHDFTFFHLNRKRFLSQVFLFAYRSLCAMFRIPEKYQLAYFILAMVSFLVWLKVETFG